MFTTTMVCIECAAVPYLMRIILLRKYVCYDAHKGKASEQRYPDSPSITLQSAIRLETSSQSHFKSHSNNSNKIDTLYQCIEYIIVILFN